MISRKIYRTILSCLLLVVIVFQMDGAAAQELDSAITKVRKNDIKVTLLSIGSGSTRITYERAFGPKNSAELTIGIIGWGYDFLHGLDSKGFLIKAAYKWNLIPMKSANSPLAGFYVKPEFVYVNFNYAPRVTSDQPIQQPFKHTSHGALMAECGYQVLAKWFVFDVYAGFGGALGTGNEENYYHSFMLFPRDSWLAFTAGFRIGVAF